MFRHPFTNGFLSRVRQTVIGAFVLFSVIAPNVAYAQGPSVTVGDFPRTLENAGNTAKEVAEQSLAASVFTYLINLMTFAADRAAYDAAVRIASSGAGETALFDSATWDGYFADVGAASAGEAIGLLNDEITGPGQILGNYNLCAPSDANILLSFKLGIKAAYQRPEPRCEINEVVANWEGFIADVSTRAEGGVFRNQLILTQLANVLDPNTNEFSVGIALQSEIVNASWTDADTALRRRLENNGFKDVTDFITKEVKTPAELIKDDFSTSSNRAKDLPYNLVATMAGNTDVLLSVGIHAGSVFTNTLLSQLTEKIYSGLFDITPVTSQNPFDPNAFVRSGEEEARESFSSILTANPISITNFSILADFASCPQSNRGLYNCVADASAISAIARAATGVPMTVQEAMDAGLLHGEWPLIPSGDHARDQDPYCYSYGYCHSNLVKLRKARVISVGWEFASESTFNSANNPVTLREVVDGFTDCNPAGQADANHPWCKLIDPNWVLKYPETSCRANVYGQLLVSSASDERQSECVDMPSCIAEDESGNCTGGYGYCVREENVWRFRGETCPAQFASCITVKNAEKTVSYLRNTTDAGPCTEDNAGCQWYATEKSDPDGDGTFTYPAIPDVPAADASDTAYTTRTYFTAAVEDCDADDAGCRELIRRDDDLSLNMLVNPSLNTDADASGLPDAWVFTNALASEWDTTGTLSRSGTGAVKTGTGIVYQPGVEFSQSRFYTLSFYARQEGARGTERGEVLIALSADDGSPINLTGTSISTNCVLRDGDADGLTDIVSVSGVPSGTTYERFSCTFTSPTVPNAAARLFAFVDIMPGNALVDDIQVEQGTEATAFHDGYSRANVTTEVVKVAPSYLGCIGAATDPAACESYAMTCTENDVGCTAYTPTNGDPVVTGVTTELDVCAAECVGYDTYKQEGTRYEPNGLFPLYFIPDTAESCQSVDVGCDEFTNLSDESLAYFTYVRACVTPEQAEANVNSDNAATFYTWEGSDLSGFQLKTWNLLESNLGPTPYGYAFSPETDSAPDLAPCVNATATENGMVCADGIDADGNLQYDWDTASCDEHADIFTTPDCREFYDADGNIHYRLWSKTVTVDAQCTTYRKTDIAGETPGERRGICTASGGFFDTAAGTCRYTGLVEESATCSADAKGCRSYTGGRSRNSRVAYEDILEDGNLQNWTSASASTITYSNDSLATGGHSISAAQSFATYVGDNGRTCTSVTGCVQTDPVLGGTCTVANGERYCGTLEGELFQGKTYTLSFWAKGTGELAAGFDFSAGGGAPAIDVSFGSVALNAGWQEYSLGPLNMSGTDYPAFGSGTALAFRPTRSVFIDNIVLREGQDNITLIKNSWVTPAVCDQSPTGAAAPQYALGCQEYTTQEGDVANLKSFTRLCSQALVGCESFFMTQESASPHAEIHNATCSTLDGAPAQSATACYYGANGSVYDTTTPLLCTIGVGSVNCTFDLGWYVAPSTLPAHLAFAASTLVTPADKDVFLVVTDDVRCGGDAAGCTEYGKPTFTQDRTATEGAESVYLRNDPSDYADILCTQDELFCSAWTGTGGTQYFFRDPGERTCEYRTDVTVGGTAYDGWFKTGTNEFCYDAPAYIIGGDTSGIWKNGDSQYDGWVGTCSSQYDSCSEYQDPLDVSSAELYGAGDGAQYFSLSSSIGVGAANSAQGECNGEVSLKEGCALFYDTAVAQKTANASATEMSSRHADALFNTAPFSLVAPINCEGGSSVITAVDGTEIDLCASRCVYRVSAVNDITQSASTGFLYGGSCFTGADCAAVESESGEQVTAAACGNAAPDGSAVPRLLNDTNIVLAVNRDRQCSEWLSCADAQTVWDERTQSYRTVCGDIELCTEYSAQGSSSFCSAWNFEDPKVILSDDRYTSRDVTWYGDEYSGFAIPDIFPVQSLTQVNVAPPKACDLTDQLALSLVSQAEYDAKHGSACSTDADCGPGTPFASTCVEGQVQEFRLVLNAGVCDGDFGETCAVGTCANTGSACSSTSDCGSDGGSCVVGQCFTLATTEYCTSDSQCGTGRICTGGFCATPGATVDTEDGTPSTFCGSATFVSSVGYKNGTCINEQCLLAPDGQPFALGDTEAKSCRAYPEVNSPFSSDLVETWFDTEDQEKLSSGSSPSRDDIPYDTRAGFENAKFCAPGENCLCSYKKVTYGEGGESRYYGQSYVPDGTGICSAGTFKGMFCDSNDDCTDDPVENPGTCAVPTREDVLLGMDGYCLERDTGINVNGDRDQNACITWLPVDQLAGSSDLFGKFTSAGFFESAYVCAYVKPFIDVKPSRAIGTDQGDIACAEGNFNCGAGTSFDSSKINFCVSQVTCPTGFYAVMGQCDEDDGGASGYATACKESADDDCPYVCVPLGATQPDGTSCDPDTSFSGQARGTGANGVAVYVVGDSDLITGLAEFNAKVDELKPCVAKGFELTEDNEDYYRSFPPSSGSDPDENAATGGYRSLRFDITYAYAACEEVLQVVSGDALTGYAWTDRMWQNSSYTFSDSSSKFRFTWDTHPSPYGTSFLSPSGRQDEDPPLVVAQCDVGTAALTAFPPDTGEDLNECSVATSYDSVPEADPENPDARSFTDFTIHGLTSPSNPAFFTDTDSFTTVFGRINQIFAAVKLDALNTLFVWDGAWSSEGGDALTYSAGQPLSSTYTSDAFDVRDTAGNAPTVWAIDPITCKGSECEEGPSSALTVNDQNSGDQSGVDFLRASLKFYAAADKNQLPIRRVIVDWGDGGNYSGSDASDNLYKNHRGLQDGSANSKCELNTEWGLTAESCDPNYFTYSHIYTCPSSLLLDTSKACGDSNGDGRWDTSPCVINQGDTSAACAFQPRIHVRDNWGWCTGTCNGTECYDGDGDISINNTAFSPLDACSTSFPNALHPEFDPWIYYDGTVTVNP